MLAALAALLVFVSTRPPGPGLDPDALGYIGAARSLAHHGTFRVPTGSWSDDDSTTSLSLWPPGYPSAIALPVAFGYPAIQSARAVNMLAAAVSAAAMFALVSGVAGIGAGVLAVLTLFVTPAIVDVHLSILSEPLFLAVLLVTLYVMAYARARVFVLSVLATIAVMVRYVGGSVPAAVVCWALVDGRLSMGHRVKRAVLSVILPALVLGAWLGRTATVQDRHGTPHLYVYGHWGTTLSQAGATFAQWLAPAMDGTGQVVLAGVFGVVLLLIIITTARDVAPSRARLALAERESQLLGAAALLIGWYLAVLCAARLFVGGTIPFDWRILSPVIVLLEVMVMVSLAHWWRATHRPVRVVIAVVGVVWIVSAAATSVDDIMAAVTDGSDFASTDWRDSPTLAWVRAHGEGHTLYSNWPPAVYFHTGRIAREIPDSLEVRHELGDYAETMRDSKGLLIGFREWSPDVVAPDSIAKLLNMREVARFDDGTVWAMP